jgi:hypothetical protein
MGGWVDSRAGLDAVVKRVKVYAFPYLLKPGFGILFTLSASTFYNHEHSILFFCLTDEHQSLKRR